MLKETEAINYEVTDWTETQCEQCMEANIIKVPIGSVTSKEWAMSFGEHLHMDIFGPLPVKAIGGYSYVLTIVDDYSRWAYMIEMKNKSDALEKYHVFTNQLKNQFNIIVKNFIK